MSTLERWTPNLSGSGSHANVVLLTTALLYLTMLLGVSTRATAAGLACNANWPLCDGGVLNLFPATLPSAFEWIHRVIAMLAGFGVLAAAYVTWQTRVSRDVLATVALGTVLLPVQVLLGRETVLTFTPPVLAAHYWVAMTIYGSFVYAAIRSRPEAFTFSHVRRALLLATILVPISVILGPPMIQQYSAPIQATQYAVMLLAVAALIFATLVGWQRGPERFAFRASVLTATFLLPIVVALMRQRIIHPDSMIASAHPIAVVWLFLSVLVATVLALTPVDKREPGS